jgi:hypothetical protein
VYTIEIIDNKKISTISYSHGSMAANTFDLYINDTLAGDASAIQGLATLNH